MVITSVQNASTKQNAAKVYPKVNENRIGIFAGSFDPIHEGHIAVAESAIENLELDKLLFMVEKSPWTKKEPISIKHRKAMVELSIREHPKIKQLELPDKRFDLNSTLQKIEALYPYSELYFIFGADVFLRMNGEQWPNLEKMFKHYIVVFEREDYRDDSITSHAKELGIVVAIIPSQHLYHSSSAVRTQPGMKQIWVSADVASYIDKNNLY